MRLCERFHITPSELGDLDNQLVADWLTIMRYEAELSEKK